MENKPNTIEDIYPASYLQVGMLFELLKNPESGTYHDVFLYRLSTDLDEERLFTVWQQLIKKHPLLRTSFIEYDKYGYLSVQWQDISWNEHYVRLDELPDERDLILHEKQEIFQLDRPGLFRIIVCPLPKGGFTFVISFYHAITDGWSMAAVMAEFIDAYVGKHSIKIENLPKYQQFIAKELAVIADEQYANFWHKYIADYDVPHKNLLLNKTRLSSEPQIIVMHEINTEQSMAIRALAKKCAVSPDVIFLGLYILTLALFYATSDIIVGLVVNNRLEEENGDKVFGLHLNTIPFRMRVKEDEYVFLEQFITDIATEKINLEQYKAYPYSKLKSDHILGHGLERDIYSCAFNYVHFHVMESLHQRGDIMGGDGFERTSIPLTLNVIRHQDKFQWTIKGQNEFIDQETAQRLLTYMTYYLNHLLQGQFEDNAFLPPIEYQNVVYDWNKTEKAYPYNTTISQLFEEQVKKTPHNIAVVFEDKQLTYNELNQSSNQLARLIRKHYNDNIPSDTLIAFCLDRSLDMIIGILGILKAGAAYVPIDPNYPKARIQFILEDTQVQWVLTHRSYSNRFKQCIYLDEKPYHYESNLNLSINTQSMDLVYVLYTSGTTGLPKGVMITHQGVNNLIYNQCEYLGLTSQSKVLQYAQIVFDASVFEIFATLSAGAALVIINEASRMDPSLFINFLQERRITIATLPPALLNTIEHQVFPELSTLVVAGDVCDKVMMEKWSQNRRLINAYGPTEATVCTTIHDYQTDDSNRTIGKPLSYIKVYVLDDALRPLPIGVMGELYIGGAGLARGYLNQDELTSKFFISNPFVSEEEKSQDYTKSRLYKTGDLVRWLPDGNLEYIERMDFQVKIRGHRIELGEIEYLLSIYPSIQQNIVRVCTKGDNQYLAAYLISSEHINESNLHAHLAHYLPDYMIPSAFIAMDAFPLTPNGKLDRNALPAPDWNTDRTHYLAPRDELESMVCVIWQELLHIPRVGVNDDFFRLGGHSILAIQVAHRMSRAMVRVVSIADLFKHRTISTLCALLRVGEHLQDIKPTQLIKVPLSFAQERLWFIEQYQSGTYAYHIPIHVRIDESISEPILIDALQKVIARHAILRTRFVLDDSGQYLQDISHEPLLIEENIDPSKFIYRSFNLIKGHPLRAGFYTDKKTNTRILLIVIHHIAFDEWSKGIFLQELWTCYNNKPLAPLEIQYKDFAFWQRNQVESRLDGLKIYWQNKLQNITPLNMPLDYPRPVNIDYQGSSVYFELPDDLKTLSQKYNVTIYTTLLAGFAITLARYTGQYDLVLGTPVANRQHPQLADLIGFFVNTLVLRLQLDPNHTLQQCITQIQNDVIEAQLHQDLPFEKLVDALNIERDTSRNPIFQVMYVVQYDEKENITAAHDTSLEYQTAKFDLTVTLRISPNCITGSIQYATALFKKNTVERFARHFECILQAMVTTPNSPIKTYPILTPAEYQQIMYDWNSTAKRY